MASTTRILACFVCVHTCVHTHIPYACSICLPLIFHSHSLSLPLSLTHTHSFSLYSDGVGRTGTFICLHSQLERLKTEGVVDIFQAVKSARIQRPGLLRNVVRYILDQFFLTVLYRTLLFSSPSSIFLSPLRGSMPSVMRCWLTLFATMTTMPTSRTLCNQ